VVAARVLSFPARSAGRVIVSGPKLSLSLRPMLYNELFQVVPEFGIYKPTIRPLLSPPSPVYPEHLSLQLFDTAAVD
jgi:hypothetical protein